MSGSQRRRSELPPWAWPALGSLVAQLLIEWIRPLPASAWPAALLLAGVAPNLIAGFGLPYVWMLLRFHDRDVDPVLADRWFHGLTVVSVIGLWAWEWLQLAGNLVFDPDDLVATLLGAVGAVALWRRLRPTG